MIPTLPEEMRIPLLNDKILSWYAEHKRDLPWRKTKDVYEILVSEIMLQQTQVDRVIPKYVAFLQQFPTAKHLAKAAPGAVITAWAGLGYNRRAVNLQKAAQQLVEGVPDDLTELAGVGPYTANAVRCFALQQDVPVVDTNIRRIFSRLFFAGKGTAAEIDAMVAKAVPAGRGVAWNNALMDFGSMLCAANSPKCGACPLQKSCTALKAGAQNDYFRIAPPQSKFEGSRRQYRGKILQILREQPSVSIAALAQRLKKPVAWTKKLAEELRGEGLLQLRNDSAMLPKKIGK
jgi:A/G-specific adenine glycosylase